MMEIVNQTYFGLIYFQAFLKNWILFIFQFYGINWFQTKELNSIS